MNPKPSAIVCSACGAETFLVRRPRFDGLKKVGEDLRCASCGHEYPSEEQVPFKAAARPKVFDASDAAPKVAVFRDAEKGRFCRYCQHYLVNPFTQRCSLHRTEVEATDVCPDFEAKPDEEKASSP